MFWKLSSSSDKKALSIVDGLGRFKAFGPHYSRRTPGSKTFTGVGQELVLISCDESAVWAVVYQRTPTPRNSTGVKTPYVWRNMLFRNLGDNLSSDLIKSATALTYIWWSEKYGHLPVVPLRTEINPRLVKSSNPGYCYKKAGFHNARKKRQLLFLDAPCITRVTLGTCSCCAGAWTAEDTKFVKGELYAPRYSGTIS